MITKILNSIHDSMFEIPFYGNNSIDVGKRLIMLENVLTVINKYYPGNTQTEDAADSCTKFPNCGLLKHFCEQCPDKDIEMTFKRCPKCGGTLLMGVCEFGCGYVNL